MRSFAAGTLVAGLLAAAAPQAAAQDLPPAVGRIEGGPWGHCTGVLVAPDQVLVLASCLRGPLGGWAEGTRLTFRAGSGAGGAAAGAAGLRLVVHPSQGVSGFMPAGYFNDAALLLLAAPLPDVAPLAGREPSAGRDYTLAYFPPGKRDPAAAVAMTCRSYPARPLEYRDLDCGAPVDQAADGAAMLDLGRGRPALAGLVQPANRTNGSSHVRTRDLGPALTDLRALAAGRDPPRVRRGGQARSSHELPGRLGITSP